MSLPVNTPVIFSRIFLKKELPVRGYDVNATLLPIMLIFESRNLDFPDIRYSYSPISYKSLLSKKFLSAAKLIVGVPSFGLSSRWLPIK